MNEFISAFADFLADTIGEWLRKHDGSPALDLAAWWAAPLGATTKSAAGAWFDIRCYGRTGGGRYVELDVPMIAAVVRR